MSIEWSPLPGAAGSPAGASSPDRSLANADGLANATSANDPLDATTAPAAAPADGGVPVASLARRASAALLDGLLLFATAFVALLIVAIANGGHVSFGVAVKRGSSSSDLVTAALVLAAIWLLPLVYWAVAPSLGKSAGRSWGHRAMKIRVVSADGTPATTAALWTRAAVLVGPFVAAVIVGPLLDAAFGTPPMLTLIALFVAYGALMADVVVAPLRGNLRQTLADRVAGTVVVDDRPTAAAFAAAPDAPLPVAGRPVTSATRTYGGVAGGAIVAVVVAAVILGLSGKKALPDDFVDTPHPELLSLNGDASTADAQAAAQVLGRQLAVCFAEQGGAANCVTDEALHLPAGSIQLSDALGGGAGASQGKLAAFYYDDKDVTVVFAIDAMNRFWGYQMTGDGNLSPYCHVTGEKPGACNRLPSAKGFLADQDAIERFVADADRVLKAK